MILAKEFCRIQDQGMIRAKRCRVASEELLLIQDSAKNGFYTLKSSDERCRRQKMMTLDHMKPLLCLLEEIREKYEFTPNFDPCDGGTQAKILFLLEAPGPKARDSEFILGIIQMPLQRICGGF